MIHHNEHQSKSTRIETTKLGSRTGVFTWQMTLT